MDIQIVNLADRMEYVDEVSEWFWHKWGKYQSKENMKYTTIHTAQHDRVPLTYIALSGDRLVGTIAIWTNDLRCRQDLFPWMTNLFVKKDMQDQGIDILLQNHIIKVVQKLGFTKLYLISTNDNEYYENTGWTFMETAPMVMGDMTKIYYKDL
ncbi:hypothetical protein PAESOLCIP111_05308 [Paenibacillus solanacearum]|uniref:N-acetyltransferase domain-containing protein n=1 Tax=Paenibacillus solanacearum TaxID=2048548 RepID=A0A916NYM5_9BACL|nr:GNAT family N-acetyltransferase [Paenibacillus solanacearum]CAG7647094.1 hypothetical protein PAESOLCIP111_05308 [Paenibacillus solanacearum]